MPLMNNVDFAAALQTDYFAPTIDTPNLFAQFEVAADSSFSTSFDDELDAALVDAEVKTEQPQLFIQPSQALIDLEASIHPEPPVYTLVGDAHPHHQHTPTPSSVAVPQGSATSSSAGEQQTPAAVVDASSDDDEDINAADNSAEKKTRNKKRASDDSEESFTLRPRRTGAVGRPRLGTARRGRPARQSNAANSAIQAAKAAARAPRAAALAKLNRMKRKLPQLTKTEQEMAQTLDLSRDELLNMTSETLEAYAHRLAAQRPLTGEEQKRFKRQRRLIKNRESAQLSRLRKKAYVDELEKQIADLSDEKEVLRRRCDAQARELDSMKSELAYLRSVAPAAAAAATATATTAAVAATRR